MGRFPQTLVVQHEDECPPAWLGEWLADAGLDLHVRRPYAGEPLPESLQGYAGLVVLGGAMGANDDQTYTWLAPVKALIVEAVHDSVATLGVCLGHQLASVALGGSVARHPGGQQIGLFPVEWTAAAANDPVFGSLATSARALQWNDDAVVSPPPTATALAGGADDRAQVLRLGPRAWTVQFHPEVGRDIVARWTQSDEREGPARDPRVVAALRVLGAAEDELRNTWRPMAEAFAGQVRSG